MDFAKLNSHPRALFKTNINGYPVWVRFRRLSDVELAHAIHSAASIAQPGEGKIPSAQDIQAHISKRRAYLCSYVDGVAESEEGPVTDARFVQELSGADGEVLVTGISAADLNKISDAAILWAQDYSAFARLCLSEEGGEPPRFRVL